MVLARRHGIPVPDTTVINSVSDLLAWHQRTVLLPWVLKSDGSWAGMGVRIVTSQNEAAQAFADMSSPAKASTAINQALLEWDFFWAAALVQGGTRRNLRPTVYCRQCGELCTGLLGG